MGYHLLSITLHLSAGLFPGSEIPITGGVAAITFFFLAKMRLILMRKTENSSAKNREMMRNDIPGILCIFPP